MTFLNSVFLAALAAITIPLLIHFLSRRRIKIVDFSSLKFLMTMQKSKLRWLKILEMILLAIRMMIIALIALAFSRPALTGKHTATHAPASVVLMVDDSPSLERLSAGGTVYDDLKRGAIEIVDMLKPGDDVTIINLAEEVKTYGPYSDFDRARETINAGQTSASPSNYKSGFIKATEILNESNNLNREIYLLSDFQKNVAWDEDFTDTVDDNYRYFALKYSVDDIENIGIDQIEFPPQLLAPGEEFEITARLTNYTNRAINGRLVEIFIDGEKRAQTSVDIKPYGSIETGFSIIPEQSGNHRGYFQLEDDEYAPDNRYYFNFNIPGKIRILGVAESPADARLLYNILGRTETGYIEFSGVNMSGFSRKNLDLYDVILINDISALSPGALNNLIAFVNSGKGLFVILGPNSNIESYKNFLKEKAGISVLPLESASETNTNISYYPLENFDLTHPIFNIYSPQNPESPDIPTIKLYSYHQLKGERSLAEIGQSATSIMNISANSKIITLGFGLNRNSSDLSVHSFIVPFIIRSVEFLASSPDAPREYYISGQTVNINLPADLAVSSVYLSRAYSSTDGKRGNSFSANTETKTLEVLRGAYGSFVSISHAGYPGFYTISEDTDTLALYSVNHPGSESISETLDDDVIKSKLGDDTVIIENQDDIAETIMQAKFGFELWKYCLVLALILLIAESILVRKAR